MKRRIFELEATSQASYYHKANVIEQGARKYLQSYDTIVCWLDGKNKLHKSWGGWSSTTSKHVCDFMKLYGLRGVGKREWLDGYRVEKLPAGIEKLENLVWDGKPHIENYLSDSLGCEKNDCTTEILKVMLLGAISRVYEPGTKFDYMLILYGVQNVGKTSFFENIALSQDWYRNYKGDFDNPDALLQLRGALWVEFGEMSSFKPKNIELAKQFITERKDVYRQKYAREIETFPRTCVFGGSTNDTEFLFDQTGNRRFLPIKCNEDNQKWHHAKNRDIAIQETEQIYAEAMAIYKSGNYSLVLPDSIMDDVRKMQNECIVDDGTVGLIEKFLKSKNRVCCKGIKDYLANNGLLKTTTEISRVMHNVFKWEAYNGAKCDCCNNRGRGYKLGSNK